MRTRAWSCAMLASSWPIRATMPIAANWNAWRKIMQPIGFATRRCGRSISSDLLALDLCAWGACFRPICSRSIFAPGARAFVRCARARSLRLSRACFCPICSRSIFAPQPRVLSSSPQGGGDLNRCARARSLRLGREVSHRRVRSRDRFVGRYISSIALER